MLDGPREGNMHEYLYSLLYEGIELVVSFSNDLSSDGLELKEQTLLPILKQRINQLDAFDSFAFYLLPDQIDFQMADCFPESARQQIEQDVTQHIENGTFAWALNNSRPIVMSAQHYPVR